MHEIYILLFTILCMNPISGILNATGLVKTYDRLDYLNLIKKILRMISSSHRQSLIRHEVRKAKHYGDHLLNKLEHKLKKIEAEFFKANFSHKQWKEIEAVIVNNNQSELKVLESKYNLNTLDFYRSKSKDIFFINWLKQRQKVLDKLENVEDYNQLNTKNLSASLGFRI